MLKQMVSTQDNHKQNTLLVYIFIILLLFWSKQFLLSDECAGHSFAYFPPCSSLYLLSFAVTDTLWWLAGLFRQLVFTLVLYLLAQMTPEFTKRGASFIHTQAFELWFLWLFTSSFLHVPSVTIPEWSTCSSAGKGMIPMMVLWKNLNRPQWSGFVR